MTYDEIIEQLEITKSKIKEIARNEYGGESWNDDLDALTEAADIVADYSKGTYTYSDLAAELRHSEGAIKRRILDLGINKKPVRCPPRKWTEDEVETLCRMVDEGYDFTLIAEKLNRTALATRGKYERLQNPEYNKRYNRGQNEDYEYQGIRSISGKDILKDRELMDGAEFQELEPVVNK